MRRLRAVPRALLAAAALALALAGCAPARAAAPAPGAPLDAGRVPEYTGAPFSEIGDGVPSFSEDDLDGPAEAYAPLDPLGRCGAAMAVVSRETMPTEERGSIGMVRPSGWHTVRYDDLIADRYLYNRCHLIGYQLTGEGADERNLITGTRYMNVEGMLPFENQIADYVERTGNRVLYRVTPIFVGDELVARGVQMEAESVEDGGAGVCLDVFCHNVQPGIEIDYATGGSRRAPEAGWGPGAPPAQSSADRVAYVVNVGSGKFHLPDCPAVSKMAERNRLDMASTFDGMVADGYSPCANCLPR